VRLGVLDVGSHTVHLLVVDAHRGARPTPMTSDEPGRRLPDHLDALVAEGARRLPRLEIGPWALREGVILRRLDTLDETAQIDRSAQDAPERLGRLTTYEARCTG
jgi:exopolyphosphatase/pppGpp-phosphohydrolase